MKQITEHRTTFLLRILPHLDSLEKIFLTGLSVGLAMLYFNDNGKAIAQFSLGGLVIVYFLWAFRILEIPRTEDEKAGFKELLSWTIIPKILWLGSSFSLLGILVYSFQLGHHGHMTALTSGSSIVAIGLLVIMYSWITGTKHLSALVPTMIRVIPIMLLAFYFAWLTIKNRG